MGSGEVNIVFNKLSVNTIDSASGIFFGTNTAIGWSSHRKQNSGFGDATESQIIKNVNTIDDKDQIDSPIDDRDIFSSKSNSEGNQLNRIDFDTINVNALNNDSAISIGETQQNKWDSHSKINYGQGRFTGSNSNTHNVNAIYDNDMVDAPIHDEDYTPTKIDHNEAD